MRNSFTGVCCEQQRTDRGARNSLQWERSISQPCWKDPETISNEIKTCVALRERHSSAINSSLPPSQESAAVQAVVNRSLMTRALTKKKTFRFYLQRTCSSAHQRASSSNGRKQGGSQRLSTWRESSRFCTDNDRKGRFFLLDATWEWPYIRGSGMVT